MKLDEIKPVGLLAGVTEAPFYDTRETFFYWDTVVPLKKDDILQLDTAKKLYGVEQMRKYAQECVRAALKEYVGPYSEKKASSIISRVVK